MGVIQEHRTEIDGRQYSTTTFPALEGLVLMPKILSLMSPSLAGLLFVTNEEQRKKLAENRDVLVASALEIASKAAENDGLTVIRDLLKYTRCLNGTVGDAKGTIEYSCFEKFNEHFAGDYIHLFKVGWWVGRVSFTNP